MICSVIDASPSIGSRMLKQSLFSPAQPWRAETRLSAGGALASFGPSTSRMRFSEVESLEGLFRSPRSIARANGPHEVRSVPPRPFTRCGLSDRTFEQLHSEKAFSSLRRRPCAIRTLGRPSFCSASTEPKVHWVSLSIARRRCRFRKPCLKYRFSKANGTSSFPEDRCKRTR